MILKGPLYVVWVDPSDPTRTLLVAGTLEFDSDNTDPFDELDKGSEIQTTLKVDCVTKYN